MNFVCFSIVFLFASDTYHGLAAKTPSPTKRPHGYPKEMSFGSIGSSCEKTKLKSGSQDVHVACRNECLRIQKAMSYFYKDHPPYGASQYVFRRCASVTDGRCTYFFSVYNPSCVCYSPTGSAGWRSTFLFLCRISMRLLRMRLLTNVNARISIKNRWAMFGRDAMRFRKYFTRQKQHTEKKEDSSLKEQKKSLYRSKDFREQHIQNMNADKDNPSCFGCLSCCGLFARLKSPSKGDISVLLIDAQVSSSWVHVLVDTGSGITAIHEHYANGILPFQGSSVVIAANTEEVDLLGKTTIDLQLKIGTKVAVTGIVMEDLSYDVILGTDFLSQYHANINISEERMEVSAGRKNVKIKTRFGYTSSVASLDTEPGEKTRPVRILARVNGRGSVICIDTGASTNIICEEYVDPLKIRPVEAEKMRTADKKELKFHGETDIDLWIEDHEFKTTALVAKFETNYPFVTGNTFNKQFVEMIDFDEKVVTLKVPGANSQVKARAFIAHPMPFDDIILEQMLKELNSNPSENDCL